MNNKTRRAQLCANDEGFHAQIEAYTDKHELDYCFLVYGAPTVHSLIDKVESMGYQLYHDETKVNRR